MSTNSTYEYIYNMINISLYSLLNLRCFHIYMYMIHIMWVKKMLYSFTLTIVITVTLQSFTVSVLTSHTSIYTTWMIYLPNHQYIHDVSIYIYGIYHIIQKIFCIHSMLLIISIVSLFYCRSLQVYYLLIQVYILYEWYILWITHNCLMFSYVTVYMTVENILYSTKV